MKKAYIIVALVVLLGASVLPAMAYPIHLFPQPFVQDGTIDYDLDGMPDVAIILGSKAAPEDVLGATLIAAKMASHLYFTNALYVDAKDAEAHGVKLYHGSFTAEAYGHRYQALDLVGDYNFTDDGLEVEGFLWSWDEDWGREPGDDLPNPFGKIFPLEGDYVFVPAEVESVQNPTEIKFSIGLEVDPDDLSEYVVFAPGYFPPAYTDAEKSWATQLNFDCPGGWLFSFDAWDTTQDFTPVELDIEYTWSHAGFYFIHPLNPIDVKIGTTIDLPWAGYTLSADTVDVDEPGSYSVGFVVYKIGGTTPVDYFHIENSNNAGTQTENPKDNDPDTFQTFLYSIIHRDIYIKADIDGDGVIEDDERLVPYFGITVRDTDEVLQTVTMDFYSLVLAPNIYPGYGEGSQGGTDPIDGTTHPTDDVYAFWNTKWFFDDTYGWPHPSNSDYADAADPDEGSYNVDVILELSNYPDPAGPRVFAGGNMWLEPDSDLWDDLGLDEGFSHSKGYIVDEQSVFEPWLADLPDDEAFLGISGYKTGDDEYTWYMVVKSGTLGATLFVQNETGWYTPLNEDGHFTAGGNDYWFTSVVTQQIVAGQECPALPPGIAGEYCGPACGPTWGIYKFTEGEKVLTEVECDHFVEPDNLTAYYSGCEEIQEGEGVCCPKNLTDMIYASADPDSDVYHEDVSLAVYHWQLNWFYPINATGVFAGIYDRVEDRNGDGIFTGATELVPVATPEGGTVYEDVTPDEYKDLVFNFASPEEVYSFVRAPIAYMDEWVFDGESLSEDVVDKALILVGGPLVNTVVKYLNDTGNLYILYKTDGRSTWLYNPLGAPGEQDINLSYAISLIDPTIDTKYVYKYKDETNGLGVIQYAKENPWNPDKPILVVAGTDRFGTLAASIALADPTKLANITIQTYYNAGVGDTAPAVIVIGIRPTTVPTRVAVQPVLVVPVGLPAGS